MRACRPCHDLPTVGLLRVNASLSGFEVQGGGPAAVITLPLLECKDVPSQDRSNYPLR